MIRSANDVVSAIEGANEFLAYRRRYFPEPREGDEVLGIWLRRELDADLPVWLSLGAIGACARLEGKCGEAPLARGLTEEAGGIRESFSLSGLWSLCWMDGPCLREAQSARQRRNRILDALVKDAAMEPGAFLPIFDATETSDAVEAMLKELRAQHPELISATWFIGDRDRGRGLIGSRGSR